MFNFKKAKTFDTQMPYQKHLEEHREQMNQSDPDEGITELQFKHNQHKNKDNARLLNKQLEDSRSGNNEVITNKALDEYPTIYNTKRDDGTHNQNAKSQDLVAESWFQERQDAFQNARKGEDYDTEFWDKYVGVQKMGPRKKITDNVQSSQLHNHPDRHDGLKKDLSNTEKIDDMVMASLKQADKMQFHIYAQASYEDRELTDNETQMINDINAGKARVLAKSETMYKKAQMGFEDAESVQDVADDIEVYIRENNDGTASIVEYSTGGGEQITDHFDSVQDAKAEYPEAEVI